MGQAASRSKADVMKHVSAETFWSAALNLPLLRSDLDSLALRVRVTPPGDVIPCIGYHYKLLSRVIEEYFGSRSEAWRTLPRRKVILSNKVPYPDHAEEIIVDGQVVGHLVFSLRRGEKRWRFRPLYALVNKMLEEKSGYYAVVDLPKLSRGYTVKEGVIVSRKLPEDSDEYVALGTVNGRFLGVGVRLRGGRIFVLKSWVRRPYSFHDANPSLREAVERNEAALRDLEEEAVRFVQELSSKYRRPVVVSFSGGKDSLATLNIAVKALGPEKVTVLFNDTGIEFPETIEYVYRVADALGVELLVASAGDSFWRAVEVFGPPARDYRWCCKVTKLAPIARVLKEKFPGGVLSLVGQRKYESAARALSPRVWRNVWLPNVVAASPIHEWSALAVWFYIYRERLPINKLYFMGFDRLGCWLCPAIELGELDILERWKPGLSQKWKRYLESYAEKSGSGEEWINFGLWRWISPPKDILRFVEQKNLPASRDSASRIESVSGTTVRIILKNAKTEVSLFKLQNLLKTSPRLKEIVTSLSLGESGLTVITSRPLRNEELAELERVLLRAYNCVECLECANWCPSKAISPDPRGGIIVGGQCTGCGLCNSKCPLAEYVQRIRERGIR
ncbi:MAG: phosphoadenosine phosphosulfate reductase family protein [Thermofilum sp.]